MKDATTVKRFFNSRKNRLHIAIIIAIFLLLGTAVWWWFEHRLQKIQDTEKINQH